MNTEYLKPPKSFKRTRSSPLNIFPLWLVKSKSLIFIPIFFSNSQIIQELNFVFVSRKYLFTIDAAVHGIVLHDMHLHK